MLNGKNWWTHDHNVEFEYKNDFNDRLEKAIEQVWNDWYSSDMEVSGLDHFKDAVKQIMSIVNSSSGNKE